MSEATAAMAIGRGRQDGKPLRAEFRLVAACCRWPPSEARMTAIRIAADEVVDWDLFLRIVERQRVWGLVHEGLRGLGDRVPAPVITRLARRVERIARRNLAFGATAAELSRRFAEAGIGLAFVKGLPLSLLLFGDLGLRHARDIDLLVAEPDVDAADAIVTAMGFVRVAPAPDITAEQRAVWLATRHNYEYRHQGSDLFLELHWRLFANERLMGAATAARQAVVLPNGVRLATLATDDLFAYLCAHGAYHNWFRLKWLADIGAILAKAPDEAERLYGAAEARGAGAYAGAAMLLVRDLLAAPLPPALAAALEADRHIRRLVAMAWRDLTFGDGAVEPAERKLGTLRGNLARILVGSGWRYRLAELGLYRRSVEDMALLPLPAPLHFLYVPLRLPLWLWRRFTRGRSA